MKRLAFIIEDDFDASNIAAAALDMLDYETEVISTGDRALERLAEATPEFIILDLHLPRVSGEEILDFIRSDARLEKTLVCIVSADASTAEWLRKKADLVLMKPITFRQLHGLVGRLSSKLQQKSQTE